MPSGRLRFCCSSFDPILHYFSAPINLSSYTGRNHARRKNFKDQKSAPISCKIHQLVSHAPRSRNEIPMENKSFQKGQKKTKTSKSFTVECAMRGGGRTCSAMTSYIISSIPYLCVEVRVGTLDPRSSSSSAAAEAAAAAAAGGGASGESCAGSAAPLLSAYDSSCTQLTGANLTFHEANARRYTSIT